MAEQVGERDDPRFTDVVWVEDHNRSPARPPRLAARARLPQPDLRCGDSDQFGGLGRRVLEQRQTFLA